MAYTYAGQFGPEAVIATVSGATVTVPNATVTVYETDGTTKSTLYTDRTKATTAANPTTTDSAGNLLFWANPGLHVVTVTGDGVTKTVTLAVAGDVSEPQADLPFLNVKDYGAVGDGTTDDLTAINATVAALGTNGGTIRLPPGVFKVSGSVAVNRDNVHFVGAGIGATKITTSSATLPVFDFGDNVTLRSFLTVADLSIDSSVTRTAGAFIRARKTIDLNIMRGRYTSAFYGVDLLDTQLTRLTDLHILNTVASTGECIRADSTGLGSNLYLHRVATDAPAGSQPRTGLSIKRWDGLFLLETQFNHSGYGMIFEPPSGTCDHAWIADCSFDNNTGDGLLFNVAGGQTRRIWIANSWFGTNDGNGMSIAGNTIGVSLTQPKFINNGQHGLAITNGTDIELAAPQITGNSRLSSGTYDGIFLAANMGRLKVIGGDIRPFLGYTNTQRRAITITAGTGDYINVSNCNVDGNMTAPMISNAATGVNNKFRSNVGFNPVGVLGPPAVPATTVAYVNAYGSDATVWVNGGTVTVVAIGGTTTGATTGAFRVPAGQSITLTYTVAPTWQWLGD